MANTKVITPSNHKRSVTRDEPIECQAIACNLLKAQENHAHTVLKYLFTSNNYWLENLGEANCPGRRNVYRSVFRPWFPNVACLSSLLFPFNDTLQSSSSTLT